MKSSIFYELEANVKSTRVIKKGKIEKFIAITWKSVLDNVKSLIRMALGCKRQLSISYVLFCLSKAVKLSEDAFSTWSIGNVKRQTKLIQFGGNLR